MDVPVFAGQGTSAANSPHTRDQIIQDCLCSTNSKFLLDRCFEAFIAELQSLPVDEFQLLGIHIDDFKSEQDLFNFDPTNAVLSGSSLFLIQILRYLSFLEAEPTSFHDTLKANTSVLGFSSGILPACVVASSTSPMSYVSNALEAYRLALWIGIRIQLYRTQTLSSLKQHSSTPWSLVVLGISPQTLEEMLTTFNEKSRASGSPLYFSAITDSTCVTVSGRPDILSLFADSLRPTTITTHWTAVYSLYHADVHVGGAREQVIADVARRNILFPTYSQLQVPIHSTFDGRRLLPSESENPSSSGILVEDVIDMLLTQRVNWSLVVDEFLKNLPPIPNNGSTIRLVNVGPGTGLVRGLEKALGACHEPTLDLGASSGGTKPKHEPVAIVGMSLHLPGAETPSELWNLLEKGGNTVSEIPTTRFKISEYSAGTGRNPNRQMKSRTGNFLSSVSEFDNAFFKISPREAKNMDPQQRLLLRTAYEALEDSGYVPNATSTFNPERMGCYVGAATNDYVLNLRKEVDLHYSTGTLSAFLSGRISYALQLGGPSMVVDTACSSSNVALYQGVRGLINGDCDAALVGGVNIISSPDMYLGLDRGHFLFPTGQCKPFSASADGYCRSEGCVIFVLKRLSSALQENDRIYALIRGIEVNQSGTSSSITHPHAPTQSSLFKRLLESSGLDAARVNVVEAHGTGTQAGDPTELESIRSVLSSTPVRGGRTNPLHIMSLKGNIGHLEAASGAAGLAKLLLMFNKKRIPPQVSLEVLNPKIAPLEMDNTVISTVNIPWTASHPGMTRVAMLNNFGAAGSNSALILEEHLEARSPEAGIPLPLVFGISGKTDVALEELRQKYLQWLLTDSDAALLEFRDIAYTATARRQVYKHRIVVCAENREELVEKLEKARPPVSTSTNTRLGDGFVFVFSGQGGQYLGMGRSLYLSSVEFRNHIDECERVLIGAGFTSILPVILGAAETAAFEASQTALFALEYALAKVWIWWGLSPTAVIGYSLGEYVALVIANVLTLHDALRILAHRARLMLSRCTVNTTGMLAVHLGSTTVEELIASSSDFSSLTVACYSSPTDCVVSGALEQLRSFKAILETQTKCTLLDMAFGYHSPAMDPLLHELDDFCSSIPLSPPTIPVASNVHGRLVLPDDSSVFDSKYFGLHCVQPVRFEECLWSLMSHTDAGTWIEVGPHPTVLPMLKANAAFPASNLLLPSIRKQHDPWMTLMSSLAQLFLSTMEVRWRNVFKHVSPSCVSLPSYPFAKSKFWIPYTEDNRPSHVADAVVPKPLPTYSILRSCSQYPSAENDFVGIFETPITQLSRWIAGHTVGGRALCPASVYIEQVLAAIQLWGGYTTLAPTDSHVVLRDMEFLKPLVHEETVPRTVITTIDCHGSFTVSSQVMPSGETSIHVRGRYKYQPLAKTTAKFWYNLPSVSRTINTLSGSTTRREVFSKRTAYEVIFPRIVEYSKEYQAMETLTVDNNVMEAFAVVKLPSGYDRGTYVVHPVFIDSLLHAAGFVANMQGYANDAFICSKIGSVKVLSHLIDNDEPHEVLCKMMWLAEEGIMLAEAIAVRIGAAQQIVAQVKGMEFRRVRLDSLRKNLAQAAGSSCPITRRLRSSTIARGPSLSLNLLPPSSNLLNNLESSVLRIVSEMCDVPPTTVALNTSLESIGVDSLMYIELHAKLQGVFPEAELSVRGLCCCKTTAEIIAEISKHSQTVPISPLSPSVTSSPRTLVAEDRLLADPSPFAVDDERPDVKEALASVLDIAAEDIEEDTPFDALGLDSLTAIELRHTLETQYDIELPCDFFQVHSTARSANCFLSAQYDARCKGFPLLPPVELRPGSGSSETLTIPSSSPKPHGVPVTLQTSTSSTAAPLFLIHDGSGLINSYEGLSSLGRTVYGIHNPYFVSSRPWESLVEMAGHYAAMVLSVATGPVILGGWSFGGVVAYEAALQLHKKGFDVKGLLLIDSPCPTGHVPLSESLIDSVLKLDSRDGGSQIRSQMRNQFMMNSELLGRYEPQPYDDDSTDGFRPFAVVLRSERGYNPPGIAEKIPAWLADRGDRSSYALGWNSLLKDRVKVVDIPGHHFEPFHSSNIGIVSLRVVESCAYLESL